MGDYEKLDEALYICYRQQGEKNCPGSEILLMEKAAILLIKLYPSTEKSLTGSTGFQWRFCKRHGIKQLSIQGAKRADG